MTRRVRIVVRGAVQGVGFRYATADAARRQGLGGHVRNLPDGSVEAEVEGGDAAVGAMLAFLEEGPPAARVAGITVDDVPLRGEARFRVLG